ncbi:insect pheromone-binding family, a10/OS-D domain-containing protein [Phthorimaea operculella]|nr:insect pheromone-binding family, a10/OS-D domain-containing protein [Phthorimaea operculella]
MIAMRFLVVVCLVVAAAIADEETYDDKYDNLDVKEILNNKRLLQAYIDCMLEKGKCTPEGKTLKDHLSDALASGCAKCTENQKKGAQIVIDHLIKNELASWKELTAKYDPEGAYSKKYEGLAKEHGITIPE